MAEYREMVVADASEVAQVHLRTLAEVPPGPLGLRPLAIYYRSVVELGQFGVVALIDGKIAGFATGIDNGARFYQRMVRRRALPLAFTYAPALARHPLVALCWVGAGVKSASRREPLGQSVALTAIAVVPEVRRRGIGRGLLQRFRKVVAAEGVQEIRAGLEGETSAAASQFFASQGMALRRQYLKARGRVAHEYVLSLDGQGNP